MRRILDKRRIFHLFYQGSAVFSCVDKAAVSYSGPNGTIYMQDQLEADCQADVYSITYKPGDYDMIRMDVQMPVMDGLEATRAVRSGKNPLGKTIPILAMTANAFTEDMEKSKEAGMDEHLSEPVDIAVLERAVRKYLVTPPRK